MIAPEKGRPMDSVAGDEVDREVKTISPGFFFFS